MILTPLTKLDAVNEICGAMGEAPVDTLENSENVDTINAVRMLEAETRAIQVMGWTFTGTTQFCLSSSVISVSLESVMSGFTM